MNMERSLCFILFFTLNSGLTLTVANEAILQEFASANNLFATSLYKQLQNEAAPNFLISPFSVETVLAFVQSGSKDETAKEIRKTLQLPDDNQKIESAIQESFDVLKGNKSYKLAIANKMYVKQKFVIKDEFKTAAANIYKADIEKIKFAQKDKAAKKMNKWIERHTNNKIHNLIDSDTLDNKTRSILINAIYFKGPWAQKFVDSATSTKNFFKTSQETIQVRMMRMNGKMFNYYENSELDAKFLEMPFKGEDVSMIFALPNQKDGLASLEDQIQKVFTPQDFKRVSVDVAIPKFKIENKLKLTETLKNLGIRKAFDKDEADLSGIAGEKGDLVIGDVIQQTYIDVREGGVEAAGASYAQVVVPHSLPIRLARPKEFIASHPFLFYVKAKGFILFAGRVTEPSVA